MKKSIENWFYSGLRELINVSMKLRVLLDTIRYLLFIIEDAMIATIPGLVCGGTRVKGFQASNRIRFVSQILKTISSPQTTIHNLHYSEL